MGNLLLPLPNSNMADSIKTVKCSKSTQVEMVIFPFYFHVKDKGIRSRLLRLTLNICRSVPGGVYSSDKICVAT